MGARLAAERGPRRAARLLPRALARAATTDAVLGWGEYGERFATVVGRDNVFGVQFHPEKSSADGLALLANFTRLAA